MLSNSRLTLKLGLLATLATLKGYDALYDALYYYNSTNRLRGTNSIIGYDALY
jgi:hypothetical protein